MYYVLATCIFTTQPGGVLQHNLESDAEFLLWFQLAQVQAVVDGVHLLIEMEKKLMAGEAIDDLVEKACNPKVSISSQTNPHQPTSQP